MKAAANRFVIDASIAVAWCFDDEKTQFTERTLDQIADGAEVVVPALWPFEVANALLIAERRKRLTTAQSTAFLNELESLNISIDAASLLRTFNQVLVEARQYNLTAYDAAYLELALRRGLPLATLDDNLKKAAKAVGVPFAHSSSG